MERRGELADGLSPAGASAAAASRIGEMFRAYPMVNMPEDKTRQVLAAYVAQVAHLPLWAIEAGCNSSVARDLPFPPSAGELRAACERAVQPVRDEESEIRKVLEAEVYHSAPKAERERVKAGFAKLLAELKETNSMEPQGKTGQKFTRPVNGSPTQLSEHALAAFNAKAPPSFVEEQ